jgi:hypothetical protein
LVASQFATNATDYGRKLKTYVGHCAAHRRILESRNEDNLIAPLVVIAGAGRFDQEGQHVRQRGATPDDEQAGRAASRGKVSQKIANHRAPVARNNDPSRFFGPNKDVGIWRRKRQVGGITDPDHVERISSLGVIRSREDPRGTSVSNSAN